MSYALLRTLTVTGRLEYLDGYWNYEGEVLALLLDK
jgi:hypothetical protein